jgi:hypothetical protein
VIRRAAIAEEERCLPDPAAQTLGAFHRAFRHPHRRWRRGTPPRPDAPEIAGAHLGPQTLRKAAQDLVPRGVAPGVVDALEMIEVQHHHGDAGAAAGHHLCESVEAVAPVVQARQAVGHGQFKARPQAGAQPVRLPLAVQLRADADRKLLRVDGRVEDIGGPEVERDRGPFGVVLGQHHQRCGIARGGTRAQVGQKAQTAVALRQIGGNHEDIRALAVIHRDFGQRGFARHDAHLAAHLVDEGGLPENRAGLAGGDQPDAARAAPGFEPGHGFGEAVVCAVFAPLRNSRTVSRARIRERTRARSVTSSTGLVRKSSAPASSPAIFDARSESVVTSRTGMSAVSGSALIRRQTSRPDISGISTSRMMRSGRFSRAARRPTAPLSACSTE